MALGDGKVRGLPGGGEESIAVIAGAVAGSLDCDMQAAVLYTFGCRAVTEEAPSCHIHMGQAARSSPVRTKGSTESYGGHRWGLVSSPQAQLQL